MHADQALRCLQSSRDRSHRDRRGIGRQDAAGAADDLELAEQAALDLEVLDDGLDHQAAAGQIGARLDRRQALARGLGRFGRQLALVGQPGELGADAGDGLFGGAGAVVEQADRMAGDGCDLRDAGAHGASADDGDRGRKRQCLAHAQAPVKRGARFSMKALTPST